MINFFQGKLYLRIRFLTKCNAYFELENYTFLHFRYLNYIFELESGPIRIQDYNDVFIAVSSTPKGLNVLIDFLVQNLDNIIKKLTNGEDVAIFIYSICASKTALDTEIVKVMNFIIYL